MTGTTELNSNFISQSLIEFNKAPASVLIFVLLMFVEPCYYLFQHKHTHTHPPTHAPTHTHTHTHIITLTHTHTHTGHVLIFKRSHKKLTCSALLAISDAAASKSPRNVVYFCQIHMHEMEWHAYGKRHDRAIRAESGVMWPCLRMRTGWNRSCR